MDIECPLGKDDIILPAVAISIGRPEEIVNQFALQKMSLKEGKGSDSIEINTNSFLSIV